MAASNPAYISLNGVLFDINETKLLQYPPASTNESYSIPGSVTTICDGAFGGCTSLTSVTVPNSVTAIESVAFADCPSLTAIYFQGNASSAETSVFDGDTNATAYYLPGTSGWGATYLGIPAMMLVPDSLLVTIAPSGAVSAGAHWQVDNGAWQNSGATVTNLSVGNHKVSFSTVPGWTTPTNQTVSVNSMATAISIYGAQTGSLQVSISPVSAPPVGAQWQVDGGVWQNSGATVANLSVGNHTISFSTITGWTTPTNQIVTINGGITTATGLYASQTITILHSFNGFNDGSSPNSVILSGNTLYCVLRALSDSDSNFCRTGFRFLSDSILISVGQGSGRLSDGFWAGLEWCPTGLERCPAWPGMVSDREWNPERKEWSDAGMGVRVAA